MITIKEERWSPQTAVVALQGHSNFRSIRQHRVDQYARLMSSGKWEKTPAIYFDQNGALIDGQHRLLAIIQSGMDVVIVTIRGCNPDRVDVYDIGVPRSCADLLKADGLCNDNYVKRVSLLKVIHGDRQSGSSFRLSGVEVCEVYPIYKRTIDFCLELFPSHKSGCMRASIIGAWGRAFICNAPEEELKIAADKYTNCLFEKGKDEALRLLYMFATSSKKISGLDDYRRSANALKFWLDNQQPSKLYANKTDPFPLPKRITEKLKAKGIPLHNNADSDE